nr:ORF3 [Torque teno felis virus]
MESWFRKRQDPQILVPKKILDPGPAGRLMSMISGPATSTPMDSSRDELLRELLALVQEISDGDFRSKTDDLNISLQSLPTSSQTETSSRDRVGGGPPLPPPQRGGKGKIKALCCVMCPL